jgi:flagellin-like protein
MHLRGVVAGNRAVSPVIGVILMVAITVVLAAVVGTFVLGVGDGVSEAPQAQFAFDPIELSGQPDELRVTHENGDAIPNDELFFAANVPVQDEDGSPAGDRISWYDAATDSGGGPRGSTVASGDSVLVEPPNGDPELEDKTFRVVWDDGTSSATLAVWRGRDA